MAKLSWDYVESRAGGYQVAKYRGLVIEAHNDTDARNPFEDFDGEPDLVVLYDRRMTEYGNGSPLDPLSAFDDARLRRHLKAIASAVDLSPAELDREARETQKDYGGGLTDIKREAIGEALSDMSDSDRLEACAKLWTIAGHEALCTSTRGYSQGDYAESLLVATPEWAAKVGAPRDSHARQLEAAAKLYGAWARGDCYGYVIKAPDGSDLDVMGDSCWGFYGSEHDESGLDEMAMDAADCLIDGATKARGDRLKELIRNRVPLALRPALLREAAEELAALWDKDSGNDD